MLLALYSVAVFVIGFVLGGLLKTFLDNDEILELEKKNARLHAELEHITKTKNNTIEIIDHRVKKKTSNYFEPF